MAISWEKNSELGLILINAGISANRPYTLIYVT